MDTMFLGTLSALILFPIVVALILLVVKSDGARGAIVKVSALLIALGSIVLAVLYYWVFKTSESGPMRAMVGILSLNKKFFYK